MAVEYRELELFQEGESFAPNAQTRHHLRIVGSDVHPPTAEYRPTDLLPADLPAEFVIGSLPHPLLRPRRPLRVTVGRENDDVTVWSEEFEEIGSGPYLTAAVEDLQQTIVELYLTLRDDQERLGPEMQRLWRIAQQHIEERS